MTEKQDKNKPIAEPAQQVKIVAEMPGDREMQDELQELKENDGYPGSCGL
jgi:hypothetical protein